MDKQENLGQVKRMDDGVRVNVSRDGKFLIIRSPRLGEQPIIKPTAYFSKLLERALKNSYRSAEQIKQ